MHVRPERRKEDELALAGRTSTSCNGNSVSPPGPGTSFRYQMATIWRALNSPGPPSTCQW